MAASFVLFLGIFCVLAFQGGERDKAPVITKYFESMKRIFVLLRRLRAHRQRRGDKKKQYNMADIKLKAKDESLVRESGRAAFTCAIPR